MRTGIPGVRQEILTSGEVICARIFWQHCPISPSPHGHGTQPGAGAGTGSRAMSHRPSEGLNSLIGYSRSTRLSIGRWPANNERYKVQGGVRLVWTNRTMVSSNTATNRTCVLAVVDIGDSLLICLNCLNGIYENMFYIRAQPHAQTCNRRRMPLAGGFSRVPPDSPLYPGAAPFSSRFTLIGLQYLVVKSRQNLSTQVDSKTHTHTFRNWDFELVILRFPAYVESVRPARCVSKAVSQSVQRALSRALALARRCHYEVREKTLWSSQFVGESAKERKHRDSTKLYTRWRSPTSAIFVYSISYWLASHQGEPGSIPGRVPDFRKWESCRTMPLVGGFSRGSPISPAPSFRRRSIFASITLIGSQDLDVKRPCKGGKSYKETCIAAQRDWAAMASDWGHDYLPNLYTTAQRKERGERTRGGKQLGLDTPGALPCRLHLISCFQQGASELVCPNHMQLGQKGRGFTSLQQPMEKRHWLQNRGAGRLGCSPPTNANRVQSPAGSLPDFRMWESCRQCRWSAGFLGDLPFPPLFDVHYRPKSNWAHVHNVCSVVVTPLESRRATSCGYNSSHPVWHALYECLQGIHEDSSPFLLQPFHELSNGFWPRLTSPHPTIQFVSKMFYRVEVGALYGPVQSANIVVGVPLHSSPLNMAPGIVILEVTRVHSVKTPQCWENFIIQNVTIGLCVFATTDKHQQSYAEGRETAPYNHPTTTEFPSWHYTLRQKPFPG
ncbi:hypothetical protein PR048_024314 [Dryococelus australis]|uniref:Uncharacterized protein n=1 Tax=Dryococelus australis TaxID=614101 RepID=A0ABQ9GNA1_9NEOP|nr:hypothetical protein PR048_024314 [Dryococelus australis]